MCNTTVIATVLCFLVALPVSAVADNTTRIVEIYIEELSRETKGPAKLAERLLREAAKVTDNPAVRSGLYQKAYEYGMQGPQGLASAEAAMEAVLASAPQGKVQWWQQLVKVRQQMYLRKSGSDRQAMGEKLLSALASAGDACLDGRLATKAGGYYQRAAFLAKVLRSPRQSELVGKARKAHARVGIAGQVERWKTRLKNDPKDGKARGELIRLLVAELDDPGGAQAYVDASVAESWPENIALAMKNPHDLDEAACLTLGVWYAKLAGTLALDLGGGVAMRLAFIPAGKFRMGSRTSAEQLAKQFGVKSVYFMNEHPQHAVTITKPFYMGVHEVTRGQFGMFVRATAYQTDAEKEGWGRAWTGSKWDNVKGASWRNPGFPQTDRHPVTLMSWNDAAAFCKWLGGRTGREWIQKGPGTSRQPGPLSRTEYLAALRVAEEVELEEAGHHFQVRLRPALALEVPGEDLE